MNEVRNAAAVGLLMAVALSAASVYAATVTVTDHGANGSGNEADAAANVSAFQSAATAAGTGGTILVPDGLYYINASLSWNDIFDLTVKAATANGATIKRVSTGIQAMSLIYPRRGYVLEGLTFDGNRGSSSPADSYGIRIDWGDDILIKDCTCQNNPYDGVLVSNDRFGITIEDCTMVNNHRVGVAITNVNHGCVITGTYFSGNAGVGLDFEPDFRHTGNHTVSGCTFDNDTFNAFGADYSPWNITVEGCDFINNSVLYATRAINIVANNNTFSGGSTIRFNTAHSSDEGFGAISLSGNTGHTSNGVNLLTNGGFESWSGNQPTGWSVSGSGTYDVTPAGEGRVLEGSGAAHLSATSGSAALEQTVAVTGNANYTFGGYLMADGGRSYVNADDPTVALHFLNSGGGVVKTVVLHGWYDNLTYEYYEKVMAIGAAPADAVNVRVTVECTSGGAAEEVCFDGLFLYEGIGPDGGDLTGDQVIFRFDFEPPYRLYDAPGQDSRDTMPDSIHVDETMVYDAGRGWGFHLGDPNDETSRRREGSDLTDDLRAIDMVVCDSGQDQFVIDVPNGRYFVTLAGGDVAYDSWQRFQIEGESYVMVGGEIDPNGAPLYIFDVGTDYEVKEIPTDREGTYGNIKCFGYNEFLPRRELLYLQRGIVHVDDGQLNIQNSSNFGKHYNWLEIAPAPAATCEDLVLAGSNYAADLNDDCHVGLADLSRLVEQWTLCNDPANEDCSQ